MNTVMKISLNIVMSTAMNTAMNTATTIVSVNLVNRKRLMRKLDNMRQCHNRQVTT